MSIKCWLPFGWGAANKHTGKPGYSDLSIGHLLRFRYPLLCPFAKTLLICRVKLWGIYFKIKFVMEQDGIWSHFFYHKTEKHMVHYWNLNSHRTNYTLNKSIHWIASYKVFMKLTATRHCTMQSQFLSFNSPSHYTGWSPDAHQSFDLRTRTLWLIYTSPNTIIIRSSFSLPQVDPDLCQFCGSAEQQKLFFQRMSITK